MVNKIILLCIALLSLLSARGYAQSEVVMEKTVEVVKQVRPSFQDGQTVQITTRIDRFVGRPSWLIVIRDLDNNQNIPYLYDFESGDNEWLALTYGRNYQILASTLSFSPYSYDPFRSKKIHNFCNLESRGRIVRGKSFTVHLEGNLTPNRRSYRCSVHSYPVKYLTVVNVIPEP